MKSAAVTIASIICIAIIEIYAMSQGFNGVALAASCSAIAGLGGYHTKNIVAARRKPPEPPAR